MDTLLQILREKSVLHAPEGKPFVLKSGATSMTYVDVRLTALSADGLNVLRWALADRIESMGIDPERQALLAGVTVGGCPLATGVSLVTNRNVLYVRPEAKDHGTGKLVEGTYHSGNTVILLEDVITSGGSTLKAIETLRDEGLYVVAVVAVLDREQGGLDKIRQRCPAEALYTLKELVG